ADMPVLRIDPAVAMRAAYDERSLHDRREDGVAIRGIEVPAALTGVLEDRDRVAVLVGPYRGCPHWRDRQRGQHKGEDRCQTVEHGPISLVEVPTLNERITPQLCVNSPRGGGHRRAASAVRGGDDGKRLRLKPDIARR